jgi:hypothetical protein
MGDFAEGIKWFYAVDLVERAKLFFNNQYAAKGIGTAVYQRHVFESRGGYSKNTKHYQLNKANIVELTCVPNLIADIGAIKYA